MVQYFCPDQTLHEFSVSCLIDDAGRCNYYQKKNSDFSSMNLSENTLLTNQRTFGTNYTKNQQLGYTLTLASGVYPKPRHIHLMDSSVWVSILPITHSWRNKVNITANNIWAWSCNRVDFGQLELGQKSGTDFLPAVNLMTTCPHTMMMCTHICLILSRKFSIHFSHRYRKQRLKTGNGKF